MRLPAASAGLRLAMVVVLSGLLAGACAGGPRAKGNLQLIDEDPSGGFGIYRSGKPDAGVMETYCRLGISEMMVLSGNADGYEYRLQSHCPSLKVIYNTRQRSKVPMSRSFLAFFDQWVRSAREQGKRIAFRCDCGCHRTGRLAAYYQMRYNRLTAADAKILMSGHGKWMFWYPHLYHQVDALDDFIAGRNCTTDPKYCVQAD